MPPIVMIVFTLKRVVETIVDEYQDWREEGLEVLFHSRTSKCDDAFIVLQWNKPIPEKFQRKLLNDDDIMDYIIMHASQVQPVQA